MWYNNSNNKKWNLTQVTNIFKEFSTRHSLQVLDTASCKPVSSVLQLPQMLQTTLDARPHMQDLYMEQDAPPFVWHGKPMQIRWKTCTQHYIQQFLDTSKIQDLAINISTVALCLLLRPHYCGPPACMLFLILEMAWGGMQVYTVSELWMCDVIKDTLHHCLAVLI